MHPVSKLADLLKQATQAYARPMGFAPAQARKQALSMALIAELSAGDAASIQAALAAGAEAILLPKGSEAGMAEARAAAGKAPLGLVLTTGGKDDAAKLVTAGADFLLLEDTAIAGEVLTVDDVERLLQLDSAWPDSLIRGVEGLPLEGAVYRLSAGGALTVHELMQLRRAASLAGKTMYVAVPAGTPASAARVLRDAGALGLIVAAAAVAEFAEAIRALPQPKRKGENLEASLPTGFMSSHKEEAEPEEDDDD
ncbi:MAG: hypothetical protein EXR52_01825 [Dehalococcoidia bacterium]|nr:hypothetical protein [Dehalococcoidia bacterium]